MCVIYCIDLPPSGCAVPSDRCAVSPETPCRSLADPGTDSANRKANILNNAQDEKFTKYFLCLLFNQCKFKIPKTRVKTSITICTAIFIIRSLIEITVY